MQGAKSSSSIRRPQPFVRGNDYYRTRGGLPRLRKKLQSGEPVRITAFGSSITAQGYYLAAVVPELQRAYPVAPIHLEAIGRPSFDTLLAAFDAQSAVEGRPDLVLLEFAVNDHAHGMRPFIVPALLGIIAQVRNALPLCEFVFVYHGRFIREGLADRLQIEIHDAVAAVLNIPSFDVDLLSADLVFGGDAVYFGDSPRALTVDGTHQSEAAAELIGIPFSQALLAMVNASGEPGVALELPSLAEVVELALDASRGKLAGAIVPTIAFDGVTFCRLMNERHQMPDMSSFDGLIVSALRSESPEGNDTLFRRARRTSPRDFHISDGWQIREEKHGPGMYNRGESLVALEPGATIRVPVCARFACFAGFANQTVLTVRIDGSSAPVQPAAMMSPDGQVIWVLAVADRLGEGEHVVELIANEPMVAVTDIYYIQSTL